MDKDISEKNKPQAAEAKKARKPKGKKNEKENLNPDDSTLADESLMPPPTSVPSGAASNTSSSSSDKSMNGANAIKKINYSYRLSYSCTYKLFKIIYK